MKIKILFVYLVTVVALLSCGSPQTLKPKDTKPELAQALSHENYVKVMALKSQVKMHDNSNKIVEMYLKLPLENMVDINMELSYLKQFYPNYSPIHKQIYDAVAKWAALKQIYQYEISPPIRILQRDQLYLAKSKVDFKKCPGLNKRCAKKARAQILNLMSDDEIVTVLKKMTLKDPCVNLSNQLKGQEVADRCLNMSKGNLKIELLAKPRFNANQWLQAISSN